MRYLDNEFKFVVVLNQKIELPKLMNAMSHAMLGLMAKCDSHDAMHFLKYENAEGSIDELISRFPVIVLRSKNSNQLRTLHRAANENALVSNIFVDTMLGSSAEDQLHKTKTTKECDMEYFSISLFGPSKVLDEITRKFSLFNVQNNLNKLDNPNNNVISTK